MKKPKSQKEKHPDAAVVAAIGGPSAVARICGVTPQTVSQTWQYTGISRVYRPLLEDAFPSAFPRGERMATEARDAAIAAIRTLYPDAFASFDPFRQEYRRPIT